MKKLKQVHSALSEDDVEPNSSKYPGLDALSAYLVNPKLLKHKDKEVRLFTSLCCMEIFYLYAPEPPWDSEEIIRVFEQVRLDEERRKAGAKRQQHTANHRSLTTFCSSLRSSPHSSLRSSQIISQLSNLTHCHNTSQTNYAMYYHILEQLANVKIGVVLVELTRQGDESALEQLAELTRTLLTLVHKDHPQEVMNNAVAAIAACVDEFESTIPTALLDELLMCVARGPNPQGSESADSVTAVPSYMCAYNVIKRCEDRLSFPIATLMNGLLNGDTRVMNETQISQDAVWGIVFEIHRIAPSVLTTVIGNVAAALQVEEAERRLRVVKLLGRLFYAQTSDVGVKFASCFKEWCKRVNDVDITIRKQMARCLVKILENKPELRAAATESLVTMLTDPVTDIRLEVVHNICDLASEDPAKITDELLHAVGNRVSSKSKTERKDAATGLAQIYQTHYSKPKLAPINDNEDCSIDEIIKVAMNLDDDNENLGFARSLSWLPKVVFESLSYNDVVDSDMRSRIIQIVDDVLLPKSLSSTARTAGVAMIISSFEKDAHALRWLSKFMCERAEAQAALTSYLDAREHSRTLKAGSVEFLTANVTAEEKLDTLVNKYVPLNDAKRDEIIHRIHDHKDKTIFKLMASISDANHTVATRASAMDELPKRVNAIGPAASTWMKTLVRRISMGSAFNFDVINHCAMLAQECARENEWVTSSLFLEIVKLCVAAFPTVGQGNAGECFKTLTEFFSECRGLEGKSKKEAEENDIVSMLGKTLAAIAPSASAVDVSELSKKEKDEMEKNDSMLQEDLLRMCIKDGSPEQARDAVNVMAAMVSKGGKGDQVATFQPLMKALTAPQRLAIDNERSVAILASLTALAASAPLAFEGGGGGSSEGRGVKAIRFAYESVLMGKRGGSILNMSTDEPEDDDVPKKSAKAAKALERQLATDRVVGAIELLVAHIRSLPKYIPPASGDFSMDEGDVTSSSHVKSVFRALVGILEDDGLPPSSRDQALCKDVKSKAAIRKAAGVGLIQMCEPIKCRGDAFLDIAGWHTLGKIFADSDAGVRSAAVENLSLMLTGQGSFAKVAPSLRFLAMVVMAADCEGKETNVNGGAANIGKNSTAARTAALMCTKNLRNTCDAYLIQCKAKGKGGEQQFEQLIKPVVMPEFALPWALHMLAFRKETPIVKERSNASANNNAFKQLKRRLKWLLDPLVQSLGNQADNISFLLRMTELVASSFECADFSTGDDETSLKGSEGTAKLATVTRAAREVLLKFVKTDAHLTTFPGAIRIPGGLFKKRAGARFDAGKVDYAKERKRIASMADDDDMDMVGGYENAEVEPTGSFVIDDSRDESRDMPGDLMASPNPTKKSKTSNRRKTDWGLSPISSPIRAAPSKVNVSINRLDTSSSQDGSHNSFSKPAAKGKKGKKGAGKRKKATSVEDDAFEFGDENANANKSPNKAATGAGKKAKAMGGGKTSVRRSVRGS